MGYRRQLERSASARRAGMRPALESCEPRLLLSGDGITLYPTGEYGGGDHPVVLVKAPDGDLWFKGTYGHIGSITESGQVTLYDYGTSGIAITPGGDVWFDAYTSAGRYVLDKMDFDGSVTQVTLPTTMTPVSLISDRSGNIWFNDLNQNVIDRYSPVDGTFSQFNLPEGGVFTNREFMTVGPDGNIWFTRAAGTETSLSSGTIDRITPDGKVTEFQIPGGWNDFTGLTTGPDGNLWFTGYDPASSHYAVGRMTLQGDVTIIPVNGVPEVITSGDSGDIWFGMREQEKVGRIDTATLNVATYPIETPGGEGPMALAMGDDGALWYTTIAAYPEIGRLDPKVAIPDGQTAPIDTNTPPDHGFPETDPVISVHQPTGPQPAPLSLTNRISNGTQEMFLARVLSSHQNQEVAKTSVHTRSRPLVTLGARHPVPTAQTFHRLRALHTHHPVRLARQRRGH